MLTKITSNFSVAGLVTIGVLLGCTNSVHAESVKLRIGYGAAAEEQLWLLIAKPDLGKNYGKLYTIEGAQFRSSDQRAQAFEAGAIDLASSSANSVIFAAAEGIEVKIIASLTRESTRGFSTSFYVPANSPIKSIKDLKGKTVAINGFATSGDLWLRVALEKNGLLPTDANVVPISFPAMAESLRSGKIDVGEFPQPFAALLEKQMPVTKLFSAKDAIPYDEELIVLVAKDAFLKKNAAAISAMLEDLKAATAFYLGNPVEARQALIDTKMVRVPADVFLHMPDYYREPSLMVDVSALKKMQEGQIQAGFQKKRTDIDALVDLNYLPK